MPLTDGRDRQAVAAAAQRLAAGELLAFATETVYGLGARADQDAAVAAIFAAKGRPRTHPLIVHLADASAARHFTPAFGGLAQRLVDAFWPGPLTLIVPRIASVADAAAAGAPTIGLRCPAHPVAQALLCEAAALGVPGVAAPSANRFGKVSPTTAAHVAAEFGPTLAVLDGGPCQLGIESTIVDVSSGGAVLLRPGVLTRAQIEAAAGEPLRELHADAPRAPGTLASHYTTQARLRLMPAPMLRQALQVLGGETRLAVYSRTEGSRGGKLVFRRMPDEPQAAAFELFAVLREFDALGVPLIWVEEPPGTPEWEGVRDRLQRAAAASS
jgi:L-threonylcarbamoyladenylate synthase